MATVTIKTPSRRTATLAGLIAAAAASATVAVLWIFSVWPFAPSVDDLVSESLGGIPAKCSTLGFAEIVGARTKVYSCAVILNGGDAVLCRAVIEGEVVTVSDEEYRGCEGI